MFGCCSLFSICDAIYPAMKVGISKGKTFLKHFLLKHELGTCGHMACKSPIVLILWFFLFYYQSSHEIWKACSCCTHLGKLTIRSNIVGKNFIVASCQHKQIGGILVHRSVNWDAHGWRGITAIAHAQLAKRRYCRGSSRPA